MGVKKLVLNRFESKRLKEKGFVGITRNSFDIVVEQTLSGNYNIRVICPYDSVKVKKVYTENK